MEDIPNGFFFCPRGGEALSRLIGILIVIIGATFDFNLLLTILLAAFATGLAGGLDLVVLLEMVGDAFTRHRFLSLYLLLFPLLGMLERRGLYEKIEADLERVKGATVGSFMRLYMAIRQASRGLGVMLSGHVIARTVVAPMALEAAQKEGRLLPSVLDHLKAMIVATENCGNFFGQNLFIASGGVLFIKAVMEQAGYPVNTLKIVLYSFPTALAAYGLFVVSCKRLDTLLHREAGEEFWK